MDTVQYAVQAATLVSSIANHGISVENKELLVKQTAYLNAHSQELTAIKQHLVDSTITSELNGDAQNTEEAEQEDQLLNILLQVSYKVEEATAEEKAQINAASPRGTFQDIGSIIADNESKAYAGTMIDGGAAKADTVILKQMVWSVESKNKSRVFVGKTVTKGDEAIKAFWS